jgi:predicted ATPase
MTVLLGQPATCPVLIGRVREIAALRSLLEAARGGEGHTVLVSGEAGIGKSRLLAAAKSSARDQGFQLFQGECYMADISYPYAPLLDLLQAYLGSQPPAAEGVTGTKAEDKLTEVWNTSASQRLPWVLL